MFLKRYKSIVFLTPISCFIFSCVVLFISCCGLEKTEYSIVEGSDLAVEVCIVVTAPTGNCPIDSSFFPSTSPPVKILLVNLYIDNVLQVCRIVVVNVI